jgi:hypothetical protein
VAGIQTIFATLWTEGDEVAVVILPPHNDDAVMLLINQIGRGIVQNRYVDRDGRTENAERRRQAGGTGR